jgi:hypothetical protein
MGEEPSPSGEDFSSSIGIEEAHPPLNPIPSMNGKFLKHTLPLREREGVSSYIALVRLTADTKAVAFRR